jgi:hypothetical protein
MPKNTDPTGLVPSDATPPKKSGRPRKKAKSQNILPVLKLDLTKDPAEQILPCPIKDQSRHLGWHISEVRSVNDSLGLYDSLPMVCQASGCYWSSQCPTAPDFMFKGRLCPLETMDVYRFFLGYIRDLEVEPDNYVDLKLLEDLVRIDLQLKRIDQQIQINGLLTDTVGGIIQSQGKPVWEKGAHPLLVYQDKLRKNRKDILTQLIATRDIKKKVEREEGRAKLDALDFMDKFRARVEQDIRHKKPLELPMIEGEVVTSDYEDEDDYDPDE